MTYQIAISIAKGEMKGEAASAAQQINDCRKSVQALVASGKAVYGVNTGFGPLCDTRISDDDIAKLQHNLLISHAVGVGSPISKLLSKVMLICKIHALSKGYSGVRYQLVERLCFFVENDLIPVVPEQGSVGASGDLAPLSHLFLPLLGEGEFWDGDQQITAREGHSRHSIEPLQLAAKEGLALINGTQFILAHAVVGLDTMAYLLDLADLAGAMSLEGCQGSAAPFKEGLHAIRPHAGTVLVAKRMRDLLAGSANLESHTNCSRVQDPYSLRCIPQVHGASRNAFDHLCQLAETEMNSVTDNPIILSDTEAISGGNFHGQPLAMVLDYASIAASELGNISDRRSYLLLEGKWGLPRLLVESGGLNSGYMIPQYTTAALVTENKSLCFPPSADSIPTSMGQEDHVSMGSISGRQFNQILDNLQKILAIEIMYAAQAIDFRRPLLCGDKVEAAHQLVRKHVATLEDDRLLKDDIAALVSLVRDRAFVV